MKSNRIFVLNSSTDESQKAVHSLVVLVLAITAIVFTLDVNSPMGRAAWALYVLPLGLTRWSPLRHLTFIAAGICTALIALAHFFCPPGALPPETDISNRAFGILMVWIAAFFLREEAGTIGMSAHLASLQWSKIPHSLSALIPRDRALVRQRTNEFKRKGVGLLNSGGKFLLQELLVKMPSRDIQGVVHSARGVNFGWATEDFDLWTSECEERRTGSREEIVAEAHHLAVWPHHFAEIAFIIGTLYASLFMDSGLMSLVVGFLCLIAALQVEVIRFHSSETSRTLAYVSMAWGLLKWPVFVMAALHFWPHEKLISIVLVLFLIAQGWLRLITEALSPVRSAATGWVVKLLHVDETSLTHVAEGLFLSRTIDRWRKELGLPPQLSGKGKPRRKAVGSAQ